jgi:hypothetical protein
LLASSFFKSVTSGPIGLLLCPRPAHRMGAEQSNSVHNEMPGEVGQLSGRRSCWHLSWVNDWVHSLDPPEAVKAHVARGEKGDCSVSTSVLQALTRLILLLQRAHREDEGTGACCCSACWQADCCRPREASGGPDPLLQLAVGAVAGSLLACSAWPGGFT